MTVDQIVTIVLRALHILAGITWAGALFMIMRVVLARPGASALLGELAADGRLAVTSPRRAA